MHGKRKREREHLEVIGRKEGDIDPCALSDYETLKHRELCPGVQTSQNVSNKQKTLIYIFALMWKLQKPAEKVALFSEAWTVKEENRKNRESKRQQRNRLMMLTNKLHA